MNIQNKSISEKLALKENISKELFENDIDVINNFRSNFEKEIEEFINETVCAYNEWQKWDSKINGDEQKAYISAFIFNAISTLTISTKLFVQGYIVPSGNLVRTAMESCAMAILCSNKNLPFFEQIKNNSFKASRAVDNVESNADNLGITRDNFREFKKLWSFYHNYSHASFLTISAHVSFSEGSKLYLGSIFDKEKIDKYSKELKGRIHIVKNLENIIKGIEDNFV